MLLDDKFFDDKNNANSLMIRKISTARIVTNIGAKLNVIMDLRKSYTLIRSGVLPTLNA